MNMRARGVPRVVVPVLALAVLASACGGAHAGLTSARVETGVAGPTYASNTAASRVEADHLLALGHLPAGARQVTKSALTPSVRSVLGPAGTPSGTNVDKSQYWVVPHGLQWTLSWLKRHRPAGLSLTASGTFSDGQAAATGQDWGYGAKTSAAWADATLELSLTADGPSRSAVSVSALVAALDPVPMPDSAIGPREHLTVAQGCPTTSHQLVGVTNPGDHLTTSLLPLGTPNGALVCAYVSGTTSGMAPAARASSGDQSQTGQTPSSPVPTSSPVQPGGPIILVPGPSNPANIGKSVVTSPLPTYGSAATSSQAPMGNVLPPRSVSPRQVRLGAAGARKLAGEVSAVPLSHVHGGVFSCPAGNGSYDIVAFSYPSGANVDLWVAPSGCAQAANGYIVTGTDYGATTALVSDLQKLVS